MCSPCFPVRSQILHSQSPLAHVSRTFFITGVFTNYLALPPDYAGAGFPPDLRTPTLELASSHLICSVALTGVLALQTGRWWAERADDDASDAEKLSVSGGSNSEKEGSKLKPSQGEGGVGLATVST
jgi:hypothetical protein